jgi:predicted transcriptional regulator
MPSSSVTSIKINTGLKARLDNLKIHPRETYNDVVSRLADMASDEEPLSNSTLKRIEVAIADLRAGRYITAEEIDKELGL